MVLGGLFSAKTRDDVITLLDNGADINEVGFLCWEGTPLNHACSKNRIEVVRILLERGADYNKCSAHGFYPIHTAARYGYLEILKILVQFGENPNKVSSACPYPGVTPLFLAVISGWIDIVDYLLSINCDMYFKQYDISVLDLACIEGNIDCIQRLINKGFDVNFNGNIIQTIYDIYAGNELARTFGCPDIGKFLQILDYLIMAGFKNEFLNDGLIIAAEFNDEQLVKKLLGVGCDVNYQNEDGITPLTAAITNPELVQFLLENGANPDIPSMDLSSQ